MSLVHLLEPSRKSFLLSTDELCFLKIMVFPLLFIDIIIAFAMFERIIIRTLEEDRPELNPKFASLWPENSQAIQFSSVQLSLPEKAMAPHSSTLAWKIPWTEEPGRLQSMGFRRVGHDFTFTFAFHFHALEKEMATHSSVLAWRVPETGEPGGLPCTGSHRVRYD